MLARRRTYTTHLQCDLIPPAHYAASQLTFLSRGPHKLCGEQAHLSLDRTSFDSETMSDPTLRCFGHSDRCNQRNTTAQHAPCVVSAAADASSFFRRCLSPFPSCRSNLLHRRGPPPLAKNATGQTWVAHTLHCVHPPPKKKDPALCSVHAKTASANVPDGPLAGFTPQTCPPG